MNRLGAGWGATSSPSPALQSSGPGASGGPSGDHSELAVRIASLEVENQSLRGGKSSGLTAGIPHPGPPRPPPSDQHPLAPAVVQDLQQAVSRLEARLSVLEKSSPAHRATAPQTQVSAFLRPGALLLGTRGGQQKVLLAPTPHWGLASSGPLARVRSWGPGGTGLSLPPQWQHVSPMRQAEPPARKAATAAEDDEDDAIDLFGSDEEEDKEAARLREERLRQYAEKKARKPELVAKSSILLDVKPVSGVPLPPCPSRAVGRQPRLCSGPCKSCLLCCALGEAGDTPWGLQAPDPASPPLYLPVGR